LDLRDISVDYAKIRISTNTAKKVVLSHLLLKTQSLVFQLHPHERFYEVNPEPFPKTNGESAGGLSP